MAKVTVVTVDTVVETYVKFAKRASTFDAAGKWSWARDLAGLLDGEADAKKRTAMSSEIGKRVGETLRGKAYSGSWVRQHAAAYKKFPDGLDGGFEIEQAFLQAVNGNAGAVKRAERGTASQDGGEDDSDGTGAGNNASTNYEARFTKLARTCKSNGLTVDRMHEILNSI